MAAVTASEEDFLDQMHLLVLEGSAIFEFPLGSRDLLPEQTIHHGPWPPADCATVLDAWFSEGLLSCVVDGDHADALGSPEWWPRTSAYPGDAGFRELAPGDATRLLRFPIKWQPGTADGNVMVWQTDRGEKQGLETWRAIAQRALAHVVRTSSRFYRRPWNEPRGDLHDDWGTAVYYFWTLDDQVEQQLELYADGKLLAYDRYHREDQYGFMTSEPIAGEEWSAFEIPMETFQAETGRPPFNRH